MFSKTKLRHTRNIYLGALILAFTVSGCVSPGSISNHSDETHLKAFSETDQNKLKKLIQASRREPRNEIYQTRIGKLYLKYDHYDDAIASFNKAIRINNNHVSSYNYLGSAYLKMGEREQALQTWQQSLDIVPTQFKLIAAMSQVREDMRRPSPVKEVVPQEDSLSDLIRSVIEEE